jgi:chorismate mutase
MLPPTRYVPSSRGCGIWYTDDWTIGSGATGTGRSFFRHDLAVPDDELPPAPDLDQIRLGIDDVDRRLIALLAERAALVEQVVHYKRAHHMPVVDRAREDRMLARIADLAKDEGVDPRVAQQVLRTIIDGFTLLEVEELGPDA